MRPANIEKIIQHGTLCLTQGSISLEQIARSLDRIEGHLAAKREPMAFGLRAAGCDDAPRAALSRAPSILPPELVELIDQFFSGPPSTWPAVKMAPCGLDGAPVPSEGTITDPARLLTMGDGTAGQG